MYSVEACLLAMSCVHDLVMASNYRDFALRVAQDRTAWTDMYGDLLQLASEFESWLWESQERVLGTDIPINTVASVITADLVEDADALTLSDPAYFEFLLEFAEDLELATAPRDADGPEI